MEIKSLSVLKTVSCPSCTTINRIYKDDVCSTCSVPLPPSFQSRHHQDGDIVFDALEERPHEPCALADSQQATQLCESFLEKGMKDSKLNIILQGMKLVNQSSEKNIIHPHILFSSVESLHTLEKFMMKNQLNPFLPFKGIITQEWDGPRFAPFSLLLSFLLLGALPSHSTCFLFLLISGLWKKV